MKQIPLLTIFILMNFSLWSQSKVHNDPLKRQVSQTDTLKITPHSFEDNGILKIDYHYPPRFVHDTIIKHDTIVMILMIATDTIAGRIQYKTNRNVLKQVDHGFGVFKGIKLRRTSSDWVWTEQPALIGGLDEKKRPFTKVIQYLPPEPK